MLEGLVKEAQDQIEAEVNLVLVMLEDLVKEAQDQIEVVAKNLVIVMLEKRQEQNQKLAGKGINSLKTYPTITEQFIN